MKNAIRYGIFFASAILIWTIIEWLLGLHDRFIRYHEYLSYFFAIPSVGIIYLGVRSERKETGRPSFGRVFAKGLAITGVATILCPVVWYIFCTWINPRFLNAMQRYAIDVKGVGASVAEVRYTLISHLLLSTMATAVIGVVISLVVAVVIAQRKY